MKILFSILSFFILQTASATNYYISDVSGNDGAAGTFAAPWKTISKVNAMFSTFGDNDSVLFKCGEVFTGQLITTGFQFANFTLASYGTGPRPVMNGLVTLSSWSLVGTNLYEADVPTVNNSKVQLVLINGAVTPMGRFPNVSAGNGGYLSYESSNSPYLGNIYDAQLSNSPNWTGAELVVRKNHWIIDRATVTSQSNGQILFTDPSGQTASAGYGYYFQDDPRTLDEQGEWYFNTSTKKLRIYSTMNPSSFNVRVPVYDTLFTIQAKIGLKIKDLCFDGANVMAVSLYQVNTPVFTNCEVMHSGKDGVRGIDVNNMTFTFNTIRELGNNGGYFLGDNMNISRNNVYNIARYAGMGASNNQARMGLLGDGDNLIMDRNRLRSIGYIPLYIGGSYIKIRNNDIDTFCITADDGGGIYASGGGSDTVRLIEGNSISNGLGTKYGTNQDDDNSANGIYMDDRSANGEIKNNSIFNVSESSLYIHNSKRWIITGNTCLKAKKFILTCTHDNLENADWKIRDITFKKNICFQPTSAGSSYPVDNIGGMFRFFSDNDDMGSFGTVDSNYLWSPAAIFYTSPNWGISVTTLRTFAQWKGNYPYDVHTPLVAVTAPADSISIFMNRDSVVAVKNLTRVARDLNNVVRPVTVDALPFRSTIYFSIADIQMNVVQPFRVRFKIR